jgi:hypothetical protein
MTFNFNSIIFNKKIAQNAEYKIYNIISSSNKDILFQNSQSVYLEDLDGIFTIEFPNVSNISYNSYYNKLIADRPSQFIDLKTRYYVSESNATGSSISYQNLKNIYLEDYSYLLLE